MRIKDAGGGGGGGGWGDDRGLVIKNAEKRIAYINGPTTSPGELAT